MHLTQVNEMVTGIVMLYTTLVDLNWAVCVPDACTAEDIQNNFDVLYSPLNMTTTPGADGKAYTDDNKREERDGFANAMM